MTRAQLLERLQHCLEGHPSADATSRLPSAGASELRIARIKPSELASLLRLALPASGDRASRARQAVRAKVAST